ncbi:hypothetical protein D3C80_984920 [compost metagenome]
MADDIIVVAGIENRARVATCLWRCGFPFGRSTCFQGIVQCRERRFTGKIEAGGVFTFRAEQVGGRGDAVMPCAGNGVGLDHRDRVFQEGIHRYGGIGNAVDEGRVRAVFQQAADEIGQQRLMGADGGIKTAGPVELLPADDFAIKRFAHAMQALELVVAEFEVRTGEMVDRRHGLGVMGRKLREHEIARGEQLAGAGDVGDVSVDLAGEDREIFQPFHLRALDFRVPVSALDEAHHDAASRTAGEINDVIQNEGAAAAIGLHDETEAVPAGEVLVERQFLQKI